LFEDIITSFVSSNDELVDVFMKSLRGIHTSYIHTEFGAYELRILR
jgi:hypothetical protein